MMGHGGGLGPRRLQTPAPAPTTCSGSVDCDRCPMTPSSHVPRPLLTTSQGQSLTQAFQGSQSVPPNTSWSYVPASSALNMTFSSQSVSSWTRNNRPHFSRLPIRSRLRCAFPAEDASALDRASRPRSNAASSVSPDPSFLRVPEDKPLYLEGRRGWGSQRALGDVITLPSSLVIGLLAS